MTDKPDTLVVQLANASAEVDTLKQRLFELNGYRIAYERVLREQSRPPIADPIKEERQLRLTAEAALRDAQVELESLAVALANVENVIGATMGDSGGHPATTHLRLRRLIDELQNGPDTSDIDALHAYGLRENKMVDASNRWMTEHPDRLGPEWAAFRELAIPPYAPADQVRDMQIAFYQGALAVFDIMAKHARRDVHAAANLRDEVYTFIVRQEKGAGS